MTFARSSGQRAGSAGHHAPTRAFTLLELLMVIGIIAFMAGGIGLALSDSSSSGLASAQNSLATLVGQARAQAAVNQTEARLMIYAVRPPGGDAEKYLRLLQVFIASPQGSQTWVPVGNPTYLPRGVFVVPTATTGLLAANVAWPVSPAPVSKTLGNGTNPNQPAGTAFNGAGTVFFVEFKSDGTINPASTPYTQLAVASGTLTNSIPQFTNAASVRGILIRPTGAVSFVNEATGF